MVSRRPKDIILIIFAVSMVMFLMQLWAPAENVPPPSRLKSQYDFTFRDPDPKKIESHDRHRRNPPDADPEARFDRRQTRDMHQIGPNRHYVHKSENKISGQNYGIKNKPHIVRQHTQQYKRTTALPREISHLKFHDEINSKQQIDTEDSEIKINDQIVHNTSVKGKDCSWLCEEDDYLRTCLSGELIAQVSRDYKVQPLKIQHGLPKESWEQRQESFQKVFDKRHWGHSWDVNYQGLNASGRGSTLYWSQEVAGALHVIINSIKKELGKSKISILDLPCGDMQWMHRFLETRSDIDYTGIDVVPDIIKSHQKSFKGRSWKFELIDILKLGYLPGSYDLILNRMLLQHLYYTDAVKMLNIFSNSASKYILTTTFAVKNKNEELNMEDNPGRVRPLNLQLPPFSLPAPLCLQRDGPGHGVFEGWSHALGLWKLPLQQLPVCWDVYSIPIPNTDHKFYGCTPMREPT